MEETPFDSLARGLNRDLNRLLDPKSSPLSRGPRPLGAIFGMPDSGLGTEQASMKSVRQQPFESLGDRFAHEIAVFPLTNRVIIDKCGAFIPQSIFGAETELTYKQLANPDGTISITIQPQTTSTPSVDEAFPFGDSGQLIMFKSKAKPRDPKAYPLRGTVIRYEAPTEPVGVEDWDALT